MATEQRQIQRRAIREICAFLRSDLYERTGGDDDHAEWSAPGGAFRVQYGYSEGEAVWCKVFVKDGRKLGETPDANPAWLDAVLP